MDFVDVSYYQALNVASSVVFDTIGRPFDGGYFVHLIVVPIVADANSVDAATVYWSRQTHYPLRNYSIELIANGVYFRSLAADAAIALVHLDLPHTVDMGNIANYFAGNLLCVEDYTHYTLYVDYTYIFAPAVPQAHVNVLIDVN